MERLLGWKFWAFTLTGYLFTALTIGQELYIWLQAQVGGNHLFAFESIASALFGTIFFILYLKPVWRWIWRQPIIGPWLSRNIFPDLNGEWDIVTMVSNWPRIDAMHVAAKDATLPRYDAKNEFKTVKLLKVETFEKAVIDQGWSKVSMTLYPKNEDKPDHAKAEESVTIAFDLLWDYDGKPQIAYLYVQKNKMEDLEASDVPDFLGAAKLALKEDDSGRLRLAGPFFTARSWVCGFNTAGELTLVKRSANPAKTQPA
jgi:hypothetical protein